VWVKLTPNVTRIEDPSRAALRAGCHGISAINTIRCVIGVNLQTLRPEPTVQGYSTPGGYSGKAIRPIALRMCMEIAQVIGREFPGRSLSGVGGIESGYDAAQFILLGCDTVQVCTAVMKMGYGCIKPMCQQLAEFMDRHRFRSISDFKGYSLKYLTTHAELVRLQASARAAERETADVRPGKPMVTADHQWRAEEFVRQSDALAAN
jgi:dihydropyrimidine dehydrogenase (NADP+)/dihydropyrimidine dehydrogenase (NAD+) subunit PreA